MFAGITESSMAFQRGIRVDDNDKVKYINVNEQFPLIEFKGDWIIFTDDDKGIKKMSPDSYLKFTRVTFGVKRTLNIQSDSEGKLRFDFYIGKKKVNFKPEGERWLRENLLGMIRSTNLGAEQRVNRIYKNEGVDGVIEEIDQIENDYIKQAYFTQLFNNENISQEEYVLILESIQDQVKSDYELGKIYRGFPKKYLSNRRIAPIYFEGIREMKEDNELSEVIRNLSKGKLDQENLSLLLESTEALKADYEKGRVLNEINKQYRLNQKNLEKMISSSGKIVSEDELSDVLENMIKLQEIGEKTAIRILDLSSKFSDDFEHTKVLENVIRKIDINDEVLINILDNVNVLKVDSESSMILRELIKKPNIDDDELIQIIESANDINSDYELSNFLTYVIKFREPSLSVLEQILETAGHLESPAEYSDILVKLINRTRDNPESLPLILESSDRLDSGYDIHNILVAAMNAHELNNDVISEIIDAAENINSEHEYYEILMELFHQTDLNPENIEYFFEAFENLTEDYTISMSLMGLLSKDYPFSYENLEFITQLAINLRSSHEYSYILFQLINNIDLDDKNTLILLEACQPIITEGELINLLVAIGMKMPRNNPELIKAYQKVAGNLKSVSEYNKALKAIKK